MTRRGRRLRVLLVDDHELVRRGIRGLLNAGRQWRIVGEARDGYEAIERARELKPDIVVLDIDMPNLNGLEAAPKIREAAPHAKIIALTLHESAEMVQHALQAGAQGLVLKSDLAERLVTAMKGVLRTKVFLTPKASDLMMKDTHHVEGDEDAEYLELMRKKPSAREVEVIRLLAEGKANKEIAGALGLSVRTVEAHRANIMKKLGFRSLADLIHYALRTGLDTKKTAADR